MSSLGESLPLKMNPNFPLEFPLWIGSLAHIGQKRRRGFVSKNARNEIAIASNPVKSCLDFNDDAVGRTARGRAFQFPSKRGARFSSMAATPSL